MTAPQRPTPRVEALTSGGCRYRPTPGQLIDILIAAMQVEDSDEWDELPGILEDQEWGGDATVEVGPDAVAAMVEEAAMRLASLPAFSSVRLLLSAQTVRDISACGAPALSEKEFLDIARFEVDF